MCYTANARTYSPTPLHDHASITKRAVSLSVTLCLSPYRIKIRVECLWAPVGKHITTTVATAKRYVVLASVCD